MHQRNLVDRVLEILTELLLLISVNKITVCFLMTGMCLAIVVLVVIETENTISIPDRRVLIYSPQKMHVVLQTIHTPPHILDRFENKY